VRGNVTLYCRWSSDDWKSDVYACKTDEGYMIYVATHRYIGDIPHVPNFNETNQEEFGIACQRQMSALDKAKLIRIGGLHDGETFMCETLREFLEKLLYLRRCGYHVPELAVEAAQDELNTNAKRPRRCSGDKS